MRQSFLKPHGELRGERVRDFVQCEILVLETVLQLELCVRGS